MKKLNGYAGMALQRMQFYFTTLIGDLAEKFLQLQHGLFNKAVQKEMPYTGRYF
jgi:hypothetical protein